MKFNITKGIQKRAVRICLYAVEGIGKTTWASKFPGAVFIDTEDGSLQLDVARFPKPETWRELLEMIDAVISGEVPCQTLVIDTVDRAEELLTTAIINDAGVDTIEKVNGGYGKGWTLLSERFIKEFLFRLDKVINKGINVVLIAHAAMRKVESPDEPPYDHWEMKLSKKTAPKVKEWTDILLFANYRIMVIEENGRNKARGKAQRKMFANHHPTYDAKNRFGLPDEMELSYEPLKPIIDGIVEKKDEPEVLDLNNPTKDIIDGDMREPGYVVLRRRIEADGFEYKDLEGYLISTRRMEEGQELKDLSMVYIGTLLDNIAVLEDQITKYKEDK